MLQKTPDGRTPLQLAFGLDESDRLHYTYGRRAETHTFLSERQNDAVRALEKAVERVGVEHDLPTLQQLPEGDLVARDVCGDHIWEVLLQTLYGKHHGSNLKKTRGLHIYYMT